MDWDFWIRAGKASKLAYNPVLIANTREYIGTKTNNGGIGRLIEIHKILRRYSKRFFPPLFYYISIDTFLKFVYNLIPILNKKKI
jgi:hypothetical protein